MSDDGRGLDQADEIAGETSQQVPCRAMPSIIIIIYIFLSRHRLSLQRRRS